MQEVPGHEFRFHHLGMIQSLANGRPAVFHRTSFNSKWFPDCTRQKAGYCRVRWVSVPLQDSQAARSLKPHMYAFSGQDVDNGSYRSKCRPAAGADVAAGVAGEGAMECDFGDAAQKLPIPVVPVAYLGADVERVLNASYSLYGETLKALGLPDKSRRLLLGMAGRG
jgi:hypothetical protein